MLKYAIAKIFLTKVTLIIFLVTHVIRIHAIYEKSRNVLFGLGALFAVQVVVMAIMCGFYRCSYMPFISHAPILISFFTPISCSSPRGSRLHCRT